MASPIAPAPKWMRDTAKRNGRSVTMNPRPVVKPLPIAPPASSPPKPEASCRHWWTGRKFDEVIVFAVLVLPAWLSFHWFRSVMRWYPKVRSFALAHRRGYASRKLLAQRLATCKQCIFGYEKDGHRYCKGERSGRGCGCGHWVASRVQYKARLKAFQCPQRRWAN